MKRSNVPHGSKIQYVLAVALLATSMAGAEGLHAQVLEHVEIKGHILVDAPDPVGSSLEVVELDNKVCVPLEVRDDGQFRLSLPVGSSAYLRFEEAGFLTKEVLVDTRNADQCHQECSRNEHLRFDVQMTPALADEQLTFAGPVGIITFLKGSGLMKVRYDRTLKHTGAGDILSETGR